jgi:hypothetical protein
VRSVQSVVVLRLPSAAPLAPRGTACSTGERDSASLRSVTGRRCRRARRGEVELHGYLSPRVSRGGRQPDRRLPTMSFRGSRSEFLRQRSSTPTCSSPIEALDSDGDHVPNLAEIEALKFPGDATDVPVLVSPTPTRPPATPTQTPTPTASPTRASTRTPGSGVCTGDCGSGVVTVDELVRSASPSTSPASTCACRPTSTATAPCRSTSNWWWCRPPWTVASDPGRLCGLARAIPNSRSRAACDSGLREIAPPGAGAPGRARPGTPPAR